MRRRALLIAGGVLLLAAVLAYLRDPVWLAHVESGLTPWRTDYLGTRFRWTAGRASFFVPSDLKEVRLSLGLPSQDPDWPTVVAIGIDGRPADRLAFTRAEWREVRLRLPPRGSRRHRRIDIHVNRLKDGFGVQLGDVEYVR